MNTFFKDKAGNDIFVLGLQTHNSSNGNRELLGKSIQAVRLFGGNTLETPIYWGKIEPEEGRYDLTSVEETILKVREAGLHLILLWFGFSKNAECTYLPEWAKRNPGRFRRAVAPDGSSIAVMSPHDDAVYEADARCFAHVLREIRRVDGDTGTVIAVQVENEVGLGLFATDRCYSKTAQRIFELGVPDELDGIELEDTGASGDGDSWFGRFGRHAHEAFTAYYLAKQVEKIAAAGKREYDIPLFMNTMVGETRQEIAGYSYSSGTPCGRVLEIWHRAAPSIDLFCPDVYQQHRSSFLRTCDRHARPWNALMIPESGIFGQAPAMNLLLAAVRFSAIGIAGFGAESALAPDGRLTDESKPVAYTYRALAMMAPILLRHRFSPRLFAVVQEEGQSYTYVQRAKYHLTIHFTSSPGRDHPGARGAGGGLRIDMSDPENQRQRDERGRVIVFEANDDEYFFSGVGCLAMFLRRADPLDRNPLSGYLSRTAGNLAVFTIEEGHFDDSGAWVCEYTLRGDELYNGVYARPGVVLRARLNPRAGEVVEG